MLHSYAFSNFRSFLERVEVSFTLTDKDAVNGWDRKSPISGQRLTTAMAVLGGNASGKTSLIQPLAFLAWFTRHSFNAAPDAPIPFEQHFSGGDLPSEFELVADALEPETLFRYRLKVAAGVVETESLETKLRRGQWQMIFTRLRTKEGKYSVLQNQFGLDQAQADSVRPNVSLISWAAQFAVPLAQRLASFFFATNITRSGRWWQPHRDAMQRCADFYAHNPSARERMVSLLKEWDLGISDVTLHELETADPAGEKKKQWFAVGVHRDAKDGLHYLPFSQESSGTQSAFALLTAFLPALESGGVVAWDELDSDLHPHLLQALLDLFADSTANPRNAQVIFTCHAVEVLRLLQKSQVMLVDKDGLESHAWRLDSVIGVRSDDNRVAKYLAGAYGAVPRL
jgi:uncharacterized protein